MSLVQMQFRRGTAAQWSSANTTLQDGELGLETDTRQFKIGNGATAWNSLGYGGIQGPAGSNGANGQGVPTGGVADTFLAKIDATNYNTSWRTATQMTALFDVATTALKGLMSVADKNIIVNRSKGFVNVLDYGVDPTGVTVMETALNNAVASFGGAGGTLWFPPGTYLTSTADYTIAANNIAIVGSGSNCTIFKTAATTGNQFVLSGYGSTVTGVNFQGPGTGTTSNKTGGIGLIVSGTEGRINDCGFTYQYDSVSLAGPLVDLQGGVIRYFNHSGIVVNHNSDHRISFVTMDNAAATLPTGSGIDVQQTASLLLDNLNVIHANWCLNASPGAGITIPSIKATNCFFDTSVIGFRVAGAGSVFRSEFTNCWFSSMSAQGIYIGPTTAGNMADGISFMNCSIYNNVAGTTQGINLATANYGKIDFIKCNIAGWTTGIATVGGATAWPSFEQCRIGAISAFAANGTGLAVAAGTYLGMTVRNNDLTGNGWSFGAMTVAGANFRIEGNANINPRGTVTTPAVPASTVTLSNSTGYRCMIFVKNGTTAPTVVTISGVSVPVASLPGASLFWQFWLDPGGTVAFTYTVVPTWFWVAQ